MGPSRGDVEASCEVVELAIEAKRVRRAICGNGKAFEADYFVAACDANVLYDRLLEGKYHDRAFQERYRNPTAYPLASQILVALGCEGTIDGIPRSLSFPVSPFPINERQIDRLTMTHYGHEPLFAPGGHTLITCAINQFHEDYDAWDAMARDSEAYRGEKARIGTAVLRANEVRFPQMAERLTILDVATPKTYERFCNAYRGAFMPFLPTIRGKAMAHTGRIGGLDNIWLSGQWLQPPGGLPAALITGKDTIMRLCKQEGRPFAGV